MPPPPAAASPPPPPPPPAPAPEEQKKLDELLKEQERQAEEQRKLEERKAEEQRQEEHRREEEERKQAELKKKQDEERRRKEAELKKKQEEKKRKEAEAKKKFDAEKISALLNKIPDKGRRRPSVPLDEQAKTMNKGPGTGCAGGARPAASASELAILAQIIRSCVQSKWNILGGGESAQSAQVKIRLRFNPDGRLASAPQNHKSAKFAVLPGYTGQRAQGCASVRALPTAARQVRILEGHRNEFRSPRHVLAPNPQ